MDKPIIFGFYGTSNSGKTTLIEKIIKELSEEGLKIATIKKTNKNIGIDKEGKDTFRHSKSGSELTIFSSSIETDFLIKKKIETEEIIRIIKNFDLFDLILIEGATDENIPKIRVGKERNIRKNTMFTYDGDYSHLIELIKNDINKR